MADLRSYQPTLRERLAAILEGDHPSYEKRRMIEGLIGRSGQAGIVDFTPAGIPLNAYEAGRHGARGEYGQAALSGLAAMPNALLTGAAGRVGKIVRGLTQADEAAKIAPMASKSTYPLSEYSRGNLSQLLKDPLIRDHPDAGSPPPVETVNISDLHGTQERLYGPEEFNRPEDHDEMEPFADLPLVARTPDHKLHILDGHHRVKEAIDLGHPNVTARVYNVKRHDLPDNMSQGSFRATPASIAAEHHREVSSQEALGTKDFEDAQLNKLAVRRNF